MRRDRPRSSRLGTWLTSTLLLLAISTAAGGAAAQQFLATGSYVGDGSDDRYIEGLGFEPNLVIIKSFTNQSAFAKTSTMPDRLSKNLGDDVPLEDNRVLGLEADGFIVGVEDEVNKNGVTYHWVAMKAEAGLMELGSYTGDASSFRYVGGLSFRPAAVLVLGDLWENAVLRTDDMALGESFPLDDDWNFLGAVTSFADGGFMVGNHNSVNNWSFTYHYVAWAATDDGVATGAYTGDENDPRQITDAGFQPQYVLVRGAESRRAAHRPSTLTDDRSLYFMDRNPQDQAIEDLLPTGFQVGDRDVVNHDGETYYWLAFANPDPYAEIALTKTVDDETPEVGDTVTFTLQAANEGPAATTGVAVADTLPAGLTFVDATASDGSYDVDTGLWTIGDLAVGQHVQLDIRCEIEGSIGGEKVINTASVAASDLLDPNPATDTASAGVTVVAADLQLTKTVNDAAPDEGDLVEFTLKLTNTGPDNATGIDVTDTLPSGLTYHSHATFFGTFDSGDGLWRVGNLANAGEATLTLRATVDAGTSGRVLTNTAAITAADQYDTDTHNNSAAAAVVVTSADLAVMKSVDISAPGEGDTVVYTVRLGNQSSTTTATNVMVLDQLPAGVTLQSALPSVGSYDSGTGVWSVASLVPMALATLRLTATVDGGTGGSTITNTATITGADQGDPDLTDNTNQATLTVASTDLDVAIAVDDGAPNEGDEISLTITVHNGGPMAASGLQVTSLLPAGLTFAAAAPAQGTYDDGTGLWNIGSLAVDQNAELQIDATVDEGTAGASLLGEAEITAVDQPDPAPDNNSDSVEVAVAGTDLQLSMAVNDTTPEVGDDVVFTLTLTNAGPNMVSGAEVTALLPESLTYVSHEPTQGSYNAVSGLWNTPALNVSTTFALQITATVAEGYGGAVIANTASITHSSQADSDPSNNTATVHLTVSSADLQVGIEVSDTAPDVGDQVTYTVTVGNAGPSPASGVLVSLPLPDDVSFVSANAGQGAFDEGTGLWDVSDLAVDASAVLDVVVLVADGAAGSLVAATAAVAAADQADLNTTNNSDVANLVVQAADLGLTLAAVPETVDEGDHVTLTLTVANAGPDSAASIQINAPLPGGLVFVSATPEQGAYDHETGLWDLGGLASGATAAMSYTALARPGSGGSSQTVTAAVAAADQGDPHTQNNTADVDIDVLEIVLEANVKIWPVFGETVAALPGSNPQTVLRFAMVNEGDAPDTLRSLVLTNLTEGTSATTPAGLDIEWQGLSVRRLSQVIPADDFEPVRATEVFVEGQVLFSDLNWALAPGDTVDVSVRSGPSLTIRDGSRLQLGIADAHDLQLQQLVDYPGDWPLVSGHILTVDGFVADQAPVQQDLVPASVLAVGSQDNVALVVDLPSNGCLADTLYGLTVVNYGTAEPGGDIAAMEVWGDGGDGIFPSADDEWLDQFVHSGALWQLTGLDAEIPPGGRRLFFTVDIAETAQSTHDIRLGLPVEHGPAVDMVSGNDGPTDRSLENSASLGMSGTDRVIMTKDNIAPGMVHPGDRDVRLLTINFTNTYAVGQTLQSLTVLNASTSAGGGSVAEMDSVLDEVVLRLDDGDGVLEDLNADPALGSGAFDGGAVTFTGLDRPLPSGESVRIFVTADVSLTAAADGDVLSAIIGESDDVWIPGAACVAGWPVDSGAAWTVDGMVAEQITLHDVPVVTLGPGDGPALALDMVVPPNGYLDDELVGLTVVNTGTATQADLALVELWEDGGNGVFDGLAGGDTPLGGLNWNGDQLQSLLINRPIDADGLRLFVAVTVADPPTDGHTLRLGIPVGGLQMASNNNGPLDGPVVENGTIVLSTSALFTTLAFVDEASSVGYAGEIRMTVRNNGTERVVDISPEITEISGTAGIALGEPTPATLDLVVDAQAEFVWSYTATDPGQIVLESFASGTGFDTGLDHESVRSPTPTHLVYTAVPRLDVYPTINLPATITRGVTNVVPLTLTLVNPGSEYVADARLDSLRVRLAESVDGAPIVPSDLFTHVEVGEGTNIYYASEALPTSGDEIELTFSPPVIVTGSEPVTLGLRLDLDINTTVPSFLLSIDGPELFSVADVVNGQPVTTALSSGDFPVMTNRADLVSPAGSLTVTVPSGDDHSASPGQTGVVLTELTLGNTSSDEFSSPILVNQVAFVVRDAAGTALTDPVSRFEQWIVQSAYQQHFVGVPVLVDSVALLSLAAPVLVPANANLTLELIATVASTSPLGAVTPVLADVDFIDAEDANDGSPIPITLLTPSEGPTLDILGVISALPVSGTGALPASLPQGVHDVTALQIQIQHSDPVGTAAVICDSLVVQVNNVLRQTMDPVGYLDRLQIVSGATTLGTVIDPESADGVIVVDLNDPVLAPQESLDLTVVLDFRDDCPTETFEVAVAAAGLVLRDAVTGERATIATGLSPWPLRSGVTRFYIPAEELVVGATSLMPPLLAPFAEPYPVFLLEITNNASPMSGDILIDAVTLGQPAGKAAGQELGRFVAAVQALVGGTVVGATEEIATDATGATVTLNEALAVPADGSVELEIRVVVRNDAPPGDLVLTLTETGLTARPPGGTGPDIRILAAAGQTFPFATEQGNVSAASLGDSYVNFPNPFAAGREETTFAFALPAAGAVTLRVLTPHGEPVITLLQDEPRGAGLHQVDTWDGVNGRGVTVRNGVYIAEITVVFDDGSQQRELRKVAVVR